MKKKKFILILIICTITLTLFTSCKQNKLTRYEAQFLTLFDTMTTIVGYEVDQDTFKDNIQLIHDDLEIYHKLFDIYNNYEGINNIKTINDNAGKKEVKVDEKIIDMLELAKEMYEKTDGYVNVAFGSVLKIWHDYRERNIEDPEFAAIPSFDELKKAAEHVDIDKLIIDRENLTVYLADENMRLDVGAIAKGYSVQKAVEHARERGLKSYLVNVGGNVCSVSAKPDGSKWNIGLQNPKMEEDKPFVFNVSLETQCLVSSGNYQRYFMLDGVRYHHIINKDTLMPENYFDAVSIICEDSGLADALTTALYNMSYEDGLKLLDKFENVEAVWNFPDETSRYTEGFKKYIIEN